MARLKLFQWYSTVSTIFCPNIISYKLINYSTSIFLLPWSQRPDVVVTNILYVKKGRIFCFDLDMIIQESAGLNSENVYKGSLHNRSDDKKRWNFCIWGYNFYQDLLRWKLHKNCSFDTLWLWIWNLAHLFLNSNHCCNESD